MRATAHDSRGQASAEFVALLPLLALLLAGAWQFVLAGDAPWHARVAAPAAARARAVGADPAAAARAHLPRRLEHALRVRAGAGEGDIRVSIRVPAALGRLDIGRIAATAHFERQGGSGRRGPNSSPAAAPPQSAGASRPSAARARAATSPTGVPRPGRRP